MSLDRRGFLKGAAGGAAGLLLAGCARGWPHPGPPPWPGWPPHRLPDPQRSGIEHVVLVMMENRSFDHLLGWLPGADGRQRGLSFAMPDGTRIPTFHQKQLNGCGFADPDHSYNGGRIQYDGGRMDGFLTDTRNDSFAISYYEAADRPFMSSLAVHYTTCDRYFCSILGPTFPNRIFQHAAQTDRLSNTLSVSSLPTIWDQLNHPGGPTGRYYYTDLPVLALLGPQHAPISFKVSQFLADAAAGTLPNVSFVDPGFLGEDNGTSNDDHPLADLRAGDAFLSQLFHAVASGPGWANTVFIINYDEWGGFYEHVPARRVTAGVPIGADPRTGVDQDLDARNRVLTGFRVPCIVASPFTRARFPGASVAHGFYDHTSVLKLIEWRWGLQPLSQRDASNAPSDPGNLAHVLDFSRPRREIPRGIPVLPPFDPTACGTVTPAKLTAAGHPQGREDWFDLRQSGALAAWA